MGSAAGRFRRALVTGAASGLGRAFALELAQPGAHLVLADRNEAGLAAVAAEVRVLGAIATTAACDVARADDVAALVRAADEALGAVDLGILCAGIAVAGEMGDVPLDDWRRIVDVNLMGVVHGCHELAPRMRARGDGHILNVASLAGLIGVPGMAPYNATKFAVVGLSEALYQELAPAVGVTVLCPSFFPTNIVEASRLHGAAHRSQVATMLMAEAKLGARDVARIALADAAARKLYSIPMGDAKALWAAKRLLPETWLRSLAPRLNAYMQRRAERWSRGA